MSKIRILLVDDHAVMRDGLLRLINAQDDMEVVGEAADGAEAVAQARALAPDVVLMDISMPGVSGLKATEHLREYCPATRVLALTRHAETGYLREVLRAGASGYVLKHSPSADVLTAIRSVAAGGTFLDQALTRRVLGAFSTPESGGHESGELSARESEVVRLLAFGYSNKEIAARLGVSVKTVESHKANAMHKLDIHARAGLVRFARIKGWLDSEPE